MPSLKTALEIADLQTINQLDLTMFGRDDLLNLILQRSEIIQDQRNPDQVIRAWEAGDCDPADAIISRLGLDLVRRALAFVFLEYLDLRPLLRQLNPRVVADIGCGYGFFDYFVQQDFRSHTVLIDLEENPHRHFQFREVAAAYTSLATARRFFVANGVAENAVTTLNPEHQDVHSLQGVDLAISLLSCGFHYPWQTYQRFIDETVIDGGSIILDIRMRRASQAVQALKDYGSVSRLGIAAQGKAARIRVEKTGIALAQTG